MSAPEALAHVPMCVQRGNLYFKHHVTTLL